MSAADRAEVKCIKCGWVHVVVRRSEALQYASASTLASYYRCSRCGARSRDFVPALADDAPIGCTMPGIIIVDDVRDAQSGGK